MQIRWFPHQSQVKQASLPPQEGYKYRSGLSKHLTKCKEYIETQTTEKGPKEKDDMLMEMLDKNKELQNIIVEQNKQISELIPKIGNTTNNNTFNSFSLQLYLI